METRPWAMYWIKHFLNDPEFGFMRFKILERRYPPMDIDWSMVDKVGEEEFNKIEANRLPLIVGSQFGLHPMLDEKFLNGTKYLAVLGKSLLSGCVAGLTIYQITQECSVKLLMNAPKVRYFRNVEIR